MSIHVSLNRTDKPSTSTHHPTIRDIPFPASTIRLSIRPWNYFPRVKSLTQPVSQPHSPTSLLRSRSLSPAPEQHVPVSHTRPDAARTPPLPPPDVRLLCNQNSKTSFSLSIGSRPGAPSGGRARTPPNMNVSRVTDVKEVGMGKAGEVEDEKFPTDMPPLVAPSTSTIAPTTTMVTSTKKSQFAL